MSIGSSVESGKPVNRGITGLRPVPHTVPVRNLELESALFRPQTGYYTDLAQMAAALFESLISNHAFVDGNKRAAFFVSDIFLRLNGWKLKVDTDSGYAFIIDSLEKGHCDYDHLLPWIQQHVEKH